MIDLMSPALKLKQSQKDSSFGYRFGFKIRLIEEPLSYDMKYCVVYSEALCIYCNATAAEAKEESINILSPVYLVRTVHHMIRTKAWKVKFSCKEYAG